jgi:hypothetical protein
MERGLLAKKTSEILVALKKNLLSFHCKNNLEIFLTRGAGGDRENAIQAE